MPPPTAASRREHYGLLRWGWLARAPLAWDVVRHPAWTQRLRAALAEAGLEAEVPAVDALEDAIRALPDRESWQAAYTRAFEGRVACSPHETGYGGMHAFLQARELADVAGFYRAFGHEPSASLGERVDHVGLELEFEHLLAHREASLAAAGDSEGERVCRDAAVAFLGAHLGRFTGALANSATQAGIPAFFVGLARLTDRFVTSDVRDWGLAPEPIGPGPAPETSEPDEPGCDACPVPTPASSTP